MPSLAQTIALNPQVRLVLAHLEKRGSISPMEALTTYGVYRLSSAIHRLRNIGFNIETELREDAAGHRYGRYFLTNVHQKAA